MWLFVYLLMQWIPHMFYNTFNYISGGQDYVQMYYNPEPPSACMATYTMSSLRTPLLCDGRISTCVEIFFESTHYRLQAKVLPQHNHIPNSAVTLEVWGTGLSCSPVDGISVSLHSSCRGDEDHIDIVRCVMMKEHEENGLTMCAASCHTSKKWDYALINIWQRGGENLKKLCEIDFRY